MSVLRSGSGQRVSTTPLEFSSIAVGLGAEVMSVATPIADEETIAVKLV